MPMEGERRWGKVPFSIHPMGQTVPDGCFGSDPSDGSQTSRNMIQEDPTIEPSIPAPSSGGFIDTPR